MRVYAFYREFSEASHAEVRDCLERTVEASPEYADAWAFLAYVYNEEHAFNLNAREHLERAANRRLLFGVNTRNLRNLEVDQARLARWSRQLPDEVVCVAESGLQNRSDAENVADWGYRAALVGSALMKSEKPAELLSSMISAGRERVAA